MENRRGNHFFISTMWKIIVFVLIFSILDITSLSTGQITESTTITETTAIPDSFFQVHAIAPTSNPVRMQCAHRIETELDNIGISCDLDIVSWAALGPRATDQEVGAWNEGGYDICFFGMSLGTPAGHPGDSMQGVYGSTAIPPVGFNVPYWSPETGKNYYAYRAQESDDLLSQINTNLNLTKAKEDIGDWQKIWYDAMPNIIIYNQYEVHAIGAGLYGYDPVTPYPLLSIEDMWTTVDYLGGDQVVLAASTGGDTFNPMIARDIYDQYMSTSSFDGLYGRTPSKGTVLPTGTNRAAWMTANYGTTEYLSLYPRMATKMGNYSADGLSYQVDMRDDVYFHDGHQADMWDLAMSFQAQMTPDIASSLYSNIRVPLSTDDKINKHGNYSFAVSDPNSDGHYERINITLDTTFGPFEGDYLGQRFYPEHILGDPVNHGFDPTTGDFDPNNQWIVKPADWKYHSTTTGRNTDPGGYEGPISTGSMIFKDFDPTTGFATLQKFNQTKWDNATGAWVADTSVSHWNIANLGNMPNNAKVIIASMDSALADLKTGGVNIMDPQFTMANILAELQTEATIQAVLSPETGWQSMYMNPKFKAQDGTYPFQKKGVHHAISHIIPREDIITNVMNGLGLPGFTPVPITSWAAISEADMLAYKKTLLATDGSTPESAATTAYDEYSRDLAFDWLDTEGYDTTAWRAYTLPAPPSWPTSDAQQWDSEVKTGTTFEFEITNLLAADLSNSWYWEFADVTLTEDDIISITWEDNPNPNNIVGISTGISYPVSIKIGTQTLNSAQETSFYWLILPLVTTDGFGEHESGIRAAERYFFNTNAGGQYDWNMIVDNASLHNTGPNGLGKQINAWITCQDDDTWESTEIYTFDLAYDASRGICANVTYPSAFPQVALTESTDFWSQGTLVPFHADENTPLINGLKELEIVYIYDEFAPIITGPDNISYKEGETGNTITWTASDNYPKFYEVKLNDTVVRSRLWDGNNIVINIDGLTLGTYNYTCQVNDTGRNTVSHSVLVFVKDSTLPEITNPEDISVIVTTTGNKIIWMANDLFPNKYWIYRNGTEITNGTWNNNQFIIINIDGLSVSTYNFTILVVDEELNKKTDTVFVIVIDSAITTSEPTTTATTTEETTTTESDTSKETLTLEASSPFEISLTLLSLFCLICCYRKKKQ